MVRERVWGGEGSRGPGLLYCLERNKTGLNCPLKGHSESSVSQLDIVI